MTSFLLDLILIDSKQLNKFLPHVYTTSSINKSPFTFEW